MKIHRVVPVSKYLVNCHQFFGGVRFFFREWNKFDFLWISCLVSERGFDLVKVVCTDSDQPASPSNILMKLVLKVDERCVGTRGELQIAEDSAGKQGSDELGLMISLIVLKSGLVVHSIARSRSKRRTSGWTWTVRRLSSPPGG